MGRGGRLGSSDRERQARGLPPRSPGSERVEYVTKAPRCPIGLSDTEKRKWRELVPRIVALGQ